MAALLESGRTGDFIPVWCWEAAAKILAFVLTRENGAAAGDFKEIK
jgi:hypothetical protein